MVRNNLLCHCEACYAELVLYIGYTLETEVFRRLKGVYRAYYFLPYAVALGS